MALGGRGRPALRGVTVSQYHRHKSILLNSMFPPSSLVSSRDEE